MNNKQCCLLAAICIFAFIGNIDFTAVNLAIVPIAREFGTNLSHLQWVLSAYAMACAIVTIPAGRLVDHYGGRRIFLVGAWVFLLSSITSSLAQTSMQLILSRIVQGGGIGVVFPAMFYLILTEFEKKSQGFVFGFFTAVIGIGLAVGPSLGGVLIKLYSWRAIFIVNIPLSLLCIALIVLLVARQNVAKARLKLNYSSIFLLAVSVVMILYAVNHIANWGVASFAFLSCFLLGIVALVFFIYLQNHIKQALIPLSLFKNKRYLTVIVLCCGEQYVFAAVLYSVGVYLQAIRHFSSELSGLILMSMTLPYLLSPLAGKMLDKKGPRQPLFLAVVSMLLGVLLLTSITYFHALIYIIAALFLIGIGVGFVLVVINAECVNCVAQELSGIASGTYLTIAVFALSVGLVVPTMQLSLAGSHILQHAALFLPAFKHIMWVCLAVLLCVLLYLLLGLRQVGSSNA